jgi:tRNA pseudouridine38-40 synthase
VPKFQVTVAYDGTAYRGFQLQPGADTVQGRIEESLSRMDKRAVRITGAGRTDSGVHAWGQVAHFRLENEIPPEAILRGLNSMLPEDIRVLSAAEAADGFHARFSARSKTYRYFLARAAVPSPLRCRFTLHYPHGLDRASLDDGAARIVGEHDFRGFRAASCRAKTTVRRCITSRFFQEGDELVYEIAASGFLHHMVRNIVGTLLLIGRGKRAPEAIDRIFSTRDRADAGPTAPPQGLHLVQVDY